MRDLGKTLHKNPVEESIVTKFKEVYPFNPFDYLYGQLEEMFNVLFPGGGEEVAEQQASEYTDEWIEPVQGETYVSSPPGPRTDVPKNATKWHNGADYAPVKSGTKYNVGSIGKNGEVIEVHDSVTNSSGKYIKVQYDNGIAVSYVHLDQIYVKEGQVLKQGQQIGRMGNTTSNIENMKVHLHLTVRKNGLLINPVKLINEGIIEYLNPPKLIPKKTN